jgi:hypothetical protein
MPNELASSNPFTDPEPVIDTDEIPERIGRSRRRI